MKVDGGIGIVVTDPAEVANAAREAEAAGFDGIWSTEAGHNPFLPLVLAAEHTQRIELGTGVAVAFARSPMTLAQVSYDLQLLSRGRFLLGLGSQIKTHIERRYSMAWSQPPARMRELICAVRAIWDCWSTGARLDFRGDFYTHTLMTPFFHPGPNPHGDPKIYLAAVGERMTEVAGEVADGLLVHGFSTERYLRHVTLPALERGLAKAGRRRDDIAIACPAFVVTGASEEELAMAATIVRHQIAFYGSTLAYRAVLEQYGWGELQTELHRLSKQGRWAEMGALIDDKVLDAFAVSGEPDKIAPQLRARYVGIADRIILYAPFGAGPQHQRRMLADLKL